MKRIYLTSFLIVLFAVAKSQDLKQLDSMMTILNGPGADSNKVKAFIYISKIYYKASNLDSAHVNADKAIALSRSLHSDKFSDQQRLGEAYRMKARTYLKNSDYRTALQFYKEYYQISEKIGDKASVADGLHGMANMYLYMGNYEKALSGYIRSAKINEEVGNKTWLANDYTNISIVHMRQKSYPAAISMLMKATEIFTELKDEDGQGAAYKNLGVCYGETQEYEKAITFYKKAIAIEEKTVDENLAGTYNNMGAVLLNQKKTKEALDYFKKAYEILQVHPDDYGQTYCLQGIGSVYIETGQLDLAQENLLNAAEVAKRAGMSYELMDTYGMLADCYAKQKDFANAYKYSGMRLELKDTIHSSENRNAISEMQTRFETDAKEKEIVLLKNEQDLNSLSLEKQKIFIFSAVAGILALLVITILIYNRNRVKQRLNTELENNLQERKISEMIIQEKNKDIIDSINYAKRIQNAILPSPEARQQLFPDSFILFKPRDIVSGDFYWYAEAEGKKIMAAVDCTGHGVPGAFMSMIGNAFLNEIVNKRGITEPGSILSELRHLVISTLKQSAGEGENKDGMDIALIVYDPKTNQLQYAGANNPLWICTEENGEKKFVTVKPDKRPIGYFQGRGLPFTNNVVEFKKGDSFYLFTDGFADQFGGPSGKKFKYKQLQEELLGMQDKSMEQQKELLDSKFESWRGNLEQVDDMLIIGLKLS